jgi:predicted dehydrogenase
VPKSLEGAPRGVRLACSIVCFRRTSIDVALDEIRALNFDTIDLAVIPGFCPDFDATESTGRERDDFVWLVRNSGLSAGTTTSPLPDRHEAGDVVSDAMGWKKETEMEQKTRREFIGRAGAAAAMAAMPLLPHKVMGANDKIVLGLVGAAARGSLLIEIMAKEKGVEVKYVCDVDDTKGHGAIRNLEEIQGYTPKRVVDMREVFDDRDVDAVVIATPDHWHGLATVWACQAGKDVYVEKCISMSIWEGRKMVEAAKKYNRVVQCGTQNRSMPENANCRDYIQSGNLGKVVHVKANCMHRGNRWEPAHDSEQPKTLNWDLWLGPAPSVAYNESRHREYTYYLTYCGGVLARSGCHQLDLVRMVLGDPPHPKSVYAVGGNRAFHDQREAPDMAVVTYDYGDLTMTFEHTEFMPYMTRIIQMRGVVYGEEFPYWPQTTCRIEIYGTERMMYLGPHGGGWQVFERGGKVVDQESGFWDHKAHCLNFLDCVRTRKKTNSDIDTGHVSAVLAHLANCAIGAGNKHLLFDGETEKFTNDAAANQLLRNSHREPYVIPEKV